MFAYITKEKTIFCISSNSIDHLKDDFNEIEYDGSIIDPIFVDGKIKSSDNPNSKKSRITLALIASDDPTKVDTEGVKGFDLDYMILQRFFGGDRGKEIGFTQRFAYLLALTDLTEEQQAEKTLIIAGYEAKEQYKEFIKSLNTYEKPTVDPNI